MARVNVSSVFNVKVLSHRPFLFSPFPTASPIDVCHYPFVSMPKRAIRQLRQVPRLHVKPDVFQEESWEALAETNDQRPLLQGKETRPTAFLHSFSPMPLLYVAALLPGAGTLRSLFGPFVEIVKSLNLPDWLVHWGHPGNMAVVLFAMGGYGTYLGFRIRFSDNVEEKAKAKDLHPKLLAGMFFFFALGATGGITSLLTSDRPIFESPHAVTGVIGLALLTVQTILPSLFEDNPGLRNVHGILGSGIMTLFLVHAALGLQLGLSY